MPGRIDRVEHGSTALRPKLTQRTSDVSYRDGNKVEYAARLDLPPERSLILM